MRAISSRLIVPARRRPGLSKLRSSLSRLDRVDEPDLVGEGARGPQRSGCAAPSCRLRSLDARRLERPRAKMPNRTAATACRGSASREIMSTPTSVDARGPRRSPPPGRRCAGRPRRPAGAPSRAAQDLHVTTRARRPQLVDERTQVLAVETCPPAVERRVLGHDQPLVAVHVGEDRVQAAVTQASSASVTVIASRVSDRLVPVVLPDEAVRLHPPGQRGLGHLAQTRSPPPRTRTAVPLKLVAGLQACRPPRTARCPRRAPPHQVVPGHVQRVARLGVQPQDLLDAVALDGEDPRDAVRVVDLLPDRVALDELADGTKPDGVDTRRRRAGKRDTCCGDEVPTLNQTGS